MTISITAEAYAAIRSTLPKGVRAEPRLDEGGGFKITLDRLIGCARFAGLVRATATSFFGWLPREPSPSDQTRRRG